MANIDIAHIREQGQDMIIAPLDESFGRKTSAQQGATVRAIEIAARGAGLAGAAVIVWQSGGQFNFIGPPQWHPLLRSIDMRWVLANVNKTLSW